MLTRQSGADHATHSILADRFIIGLFILMVLLGSSLFLSGTAMAASGSAKGHQIPLTGLCSNPAPNGHCYAERYWPGHTGGANTLLSPLGAISCSGCSGFITDEMWFVDPNSSQCVATTYKQCWVEAGFSTYVAGDPNSCNSSIASICGFWADNRPNGGSYHEHPLYYFGPDGTNLVPYDFYVTIANNGGNSSSGSTWNIDTNIYKNSTWIAGPSGQSTNNTMNVNKITIGSELADSRASATTLYYEYNQWLGSNGVWNYQTTDGSNDSTGTPSTGAWYIHPCSCSGNTGGEFYTYD
jgi:hypothetical protein